MRAFRTIFCAATIGCGALWAYGADRAQAEGAIAIGSTGSVAKDGYSIGINVNSSTEADAKRQALAWCRSHGSQVTQRECKIVTTFCHQCPAEAEDPKDGTPGFGWAVVADEASAKSVAIDHCPATAGNRREFCKVVNTLCDTTP